MAGNILAPLKVAPLRCGEGRSISGSSRSVVLALRASSTSSKPEPKRAAITEGQRVEASYRVVSSLTAQGAKPQEFESPKTKMRFRFIGKNSNSSQVAAATVKARRRR